MQNPLEFTNSVKKIDAKVERYYLSLDTEKRKIISDGIVEKKQYFDSPIKILWILKEPYDLENNGDDTWPLNDFLNNENELQKLGGFKTTWYPIIYTSYAILNGFLKYEDMSFIDDDLDMLNIFKKIAVINVQKFPAKTTTKNSEITAAYKTHSKILLEQIATYNPNIIIGGNTMLNFVEDLGLKDFKYYDEYDYWIKANQLFIHAAHPAFRGNDEAKEAYVNDIVRISKNFSNKNSDKFKIINP